MKKIVVLGGYGEMGQVAVRDLVETCKNCEIVIAGRDIKKAEMFAKFFNKKNVKAVEADAEDIEKTSEILKGAAVVVNATQYYMNLQVMEACLKAGTNYLDLGGLFHMTRKQLKLDKKFKKKNLIAILGCGATPGITNVMAAYGEKFLDKISEIYIRFSGKDFTNYNQPFVVPYSMYTVFDEFEDKPAVFKNGKIIFVEPMSGEEAEYFPDPVGLASCFYTLHSEIATFPSSFKKKGLKESDFKAGFDKDFVEKVKFLVETAIASKEPIEVSPGIKVSPRDVVAKELNRFCIFCKPQTEIKVNDLEILRVKIKGIQNGKETELIVDCLAKSNRKWNLPAGSVDTGVPPSIIAQMIANKKIKKKGVLPPELCVDPIYFFKELAKRNMKIYTTTKREIN